MAVKKSKSEIKGLNPKIKKTFSESEFSVLLENIDDTVKMLAESHIDLDRKIDIMGKNLEGKIDSLDRRMDSMEGKMDSMEKEMRSSFKTIFEYLLHIDSEISEIKIKLDSKADKKELAAIEQRLSKLELEFVECKKMIALAKNN